jgi:hypothetical protein
MIKRLPLVLTVLLVHTAAAHAQQSPAVQDQVNTAQDGYPPGYAPPPGFAPPANTPPPPPPPPPPGPPPAYGPPQPYYGPGYQPQPYYGPGPGYPPPRRYPPPSYYYQTPPPPPPSNYRPFTLGGGIGFGGLSFVDATGRRVAAEGGAYTARLGFGLRPGLILMWDLEGTVASRDANTASQTAHLLALQLFPTRRFFLKAGFGIAQSIDSGRPSQRLSEGAWGGAGMVGMGYELIQGWNWSFDIEATYTGARYSINGIDQTWSNWSAVNFAINFF